MVLNKMTSKMELSNYEKRVLLALDKLEKAQPEEIMEKAGFKRVVEVNHAASWLRSKGLVTIDEDVVKSYSLARKRYAAKGLAERRALKELDKAGGVLPISQLAKSNKLEKFEVPIATGWLKKKKWAEIRKVGGETVLEMTTEGKKALKKSGADEDIIKQLADEDLLENEMDGIALKNLKGRKDILKENEVVKRTISLTEKGRSELEKGIELGKDVAQLTPKMLQTEEWKKADFRRYDISAFAPTLYGGRKHPLKEIIDQIREIFVAMGFQEVETGFVQSAFWNMDALFTAQDHPVRDLHDTFYLDQPSKMDLPDEDIVKKVKEVHENGGETGSTGWGYQWSEEEAKKAMIRTHTTVNTVRYMVENPDPPARIFSIGRVFRNESIDATHLPEFYQVEGIICEEGANFAMLCGLLREFLARLGFPKIRIRPGYFPYTEPSLEVDIFYKGEWMELAGAGIFRPEVTEVHGVEHPVLAWGFGLERLAIVLTGVKDLRELYVSDLDWLRNSKML